MSHLTHSVLNNTPHFPGRYGNMFPSPVLLSVTVLSALQTALVGTALPYELWSVAVEKQAHAEKFPYYFSTNYATYSMHFGRKMVFLITSIRSKIIYLGKKQIVRNMHSKVKSYTCTRHGGISAWTAVCYSLLLRFRFVRKFLSLSYSEGIRKLYWCGIQGFSCQ